METVSSTGLKEEKKSLPIRMWLLLSVEEGLYLLKTTTFSINTKRDANNVNRAIKFDVTIDFVL
jgi:hypothetical protein